MVEWSRLERFCTLFFFRFEYIHCAVSSHTPHSYLSRRAMFRFPNCCFFVRFYIAERFVHYPENWKPLQCLCCQVASQDLGILLVRFRIQPTSILKPGYVLLLAWFESISQGRLVTLHDFPGQSLRTVLSFLRIRMEQLFMLVAYMSHDYSR